MLSSTLRCAALTEPLIDGGDYVLDSSGYVVTYDPRTVTGVEPGASLFLPLTAKGTPSVDHSTSRYLKQPCFTVTLTAASPGLAIMFTHMMDLRWDAKGKKTEKVAHFNLIPTTALGAGLSPGAFQTLVQSCTWMVCGMEAGASVEPATGDDAIDSDSRPDWDYREVARWPDIRVLRLFRAMKSVHPYLSGWQRLHANDVLTTLASNPSEAPTLDVFLACTERARRAFWIFESFNTSGKPGVFAEAMEEYTLEVGTRMRWGPYAVDESEAAGELVLCALPE